MNLEDEPRQMSRQLEFPWMDRGESPKDLWSDESSTARQGNELSGEDSLMERVLAHPNMKAALGRVKRNRGGPGVDGMTVDELLPYLGEHWERIKSSLLDGSYNPSPVKRQEIPKSGGGTRELGIPTVLDRCIQQVMRHLRKLYGNLHLKINEAKSAVASAHKRDFLGFGLWSAPGKKVRLRVSKKALEGMRDRVREIMGRNRGRSMKAVAEELRRYLLGWRAYYGIVHTNQVLRRQDEWIRRRLRMLHLKQWKRGRTTFRELRARGASKRVAAEVAGHTTR